MTKLDAYEHLCTYDKRNPDYIDERYLLDEGEKERKPRDNCYCDNCFRGKDNLALVIIELLEVIEKF